MQPLTEDRKNTIEFYLRQGFSYHKIAKLVKVSSSTVHKIRLELGLPARIDKGGRPKALTKREQQHLVRAVTVDGLENAVQAQQSLEQNLGKSVSVDTVRRALRDAGLVSFVRPKKPLINERNRKRRLQWARQHIDWTVNDWMNVIWSDETKINRFGSDGKSYAWKVPGQPLKKHHVRETVKHGGGSIMVWSCISWYGPGYIVDVGKNMTKDAYLEVLQDDLMKSLAWYMEESGNPTNQFIFMQDNDPKHTAKVVSKWLNEQDFHVMKWPPQSPDLNPIENMWKLLKRRLFRSYDCPPCGIHELWDCIGHTWYQITAEECQKFIKSMPDRCSAVIEANGFYIGY
ncbi:hypothetical protein G6F49_013039 [Rhizopus delemar]|nr:hypothetical protein G6F49_013039 [Rhizopus delemar]